MTMFSGVKRQERWCFKFRSFWSRGIRGDFLYSAMFEKVACKLEMIFRSLVVCLS